MVQNWKDKLDAAKRFVKNHKKLIFVAGEAAVLTAVGVIAYQKGRQNGINESSIANQADTFKEIFKEFNVTTF